MTIYAGVGSSRPFPPTSPFWLICFVMFCIRCQTCAQAPAESPSLLESPKRNCCIYCLPESACPATRHFRVHSFRHCRFFQEYAVATAQGQRLRETQRSYCAIYHKPECHVLHTDRRIYNFYCSIAISSQTKRCTPLSYACDHFCANGRAFCVLNSTILSENTHSLLISLGSDLRRELDANFHIDTCSSTSPRRACLSRINPQQSICRRSLQLGFPYIHLQLQDCCS